MPVSQNELKTILSRLSGAAADEINDETALIEDLHLDSLKLVELLAILGEDYDMTVNEEDAINFHTFKDLWDFTQENSQ